MPSIIYFPLKTCRSPIVSYLLVLLIALLCALPLKALYYEPENPFIAPNEVPVILNISSGTIASVQQAIDTARGANPDAFIIINLSGAYTVTSTPLVLRSKQILYLDGSIIAGSSAATANALISVGSGQSFVAIMGFGPGSVLDGQNADMHGIEALASSRLIIDNLTVQHTLRDGVSLQGLGNTVWDAQISISRCKVSGSGGSGIRLYDANQCAVVDNITQNNTLAGIQLSADTTAVAYNICNFNATGISVSGTTNSIYKNTCNGNASGIRLTTTSSVTKVTANTFSSNSVSGVAVEGSQNTVFDNNYSGNTLDLDSQGSNNFILASTKPLDGTGNNYFYPPTARNSHSSTHIINGMGRRDLTISNTTIDEVQQQYDAARADHPNDVIVLTLDGTFTLGANPLNLASNTCVLLQEGTSIISDSTTTATYAIAATNASFISVSGGTLNANLEPVGGVQFLECSKLLVDGMTMLSNRDHTVAGSSDMLHIKGAVGDAKIVRGCTIDTCDFRGIWIQTSRALITENIVTNCNKDGIDLDSFSSKCFVANNTCTDNIRYGVFVEEAANRNIVLSNNLHRNQMGINLYTYEVTQPTQYNSILTNFLDANGRGLRSGERDTPVDRETKHNYFYNNRITNSETHAINTQNNGIQNYYSENLLQNQSISSTNPNTVFFNPSQIGSIQNTSGTAFDLTQANTWASGELPDPLDTPSFQNAGTYNAPASSNLTYKGISIEQANVAINPPTGGNAYSINLGTGGISGTQPLLVMGENITLDVGANDQSWTIPLNNFRSAIQGSATITYTNPSRLWLRNYANYNFEGIWRADAGTIHPEVAVCWSGANDEVPAQVLNEGAIRLSNTSYDRIGLDLLGNGSLIASGSSFNDGSAATLGTGQWTQAGDVWGSGNLTISSNANYGKVIIAGDISHKGNTTIDNKSAGMVLELGASSTYTFYPTITGICNQINGQDPTNSQLIANGTFIINTATANLTDGNSWVLVDLSSLEESFGNSFAVQGFTNSSDNWTRIDGNRIWTFMEATGVLTLSNNPYSLIGLPFSTDFESDSIGSEPEDLAKILNTDIYGNSLNVTAANSPFIDGPGSATSGASGTQAIHWLETNISSTATKPSLYLIDLPTSTSMDMVIRLSYTNVNSNNSTNALRLQVYDDAQTRGIRLDLDNGGRILNNGSVSDFTLYPGFNKWTTLEITTNLANNTYDLVIQREDHASPTTYTGLSFNNSISNISRVALVNFSGPAISSEYYIDDVSVQPVLVGAYDNWAFEKGLSFGINHRFLDDPDGDNLNNFGEFSLSGDPLLAASNPARTQHQLSYVDSTAVLNLTFPARDGAVFSGAAGQSSLTIDGVIYRIQGSTDLINWNLEVNEVTGIEASAIHAGLYSLDSGWSYRTFRLTPTVLTESKGFLQLLLDSP
ncbi:right-handed parallel beta-helix repeat-containing protein [Opitutales bacterium]|nr:right-handed parallel beta-helix repeat-containing protein [Opitutales bacterium]